MIVHETEKKRPLSASIYCPAPIVNRPNSASLRPRSAHVFSRNASANLRR